MKFTMYTDGASRGNPGPAGVGIVLLNNDNIVFEGKEFLGEKTNNEAEYLALICGLEEASKKTKEIAVFSDSQLLVSQINGDFKIKKDHIKELYNQAKILISSLSFFSIEHTLREGNKKADMLANEAIDEFLEGKREVKQFGFAKQPKLF